MHIERISTNVCLYIGQAYGLDEQSKVPTEVCLFIYIYLFQTPTQPVVCYLQSVAGPYIRLLDNNNIVFDYLN